MKELDRQTMPGEHLIGSLSYVISYVIMYTKLKCYSQLLYTTHVAEMQEQ